MNPELKCGLEIHQQLEGRKLFMATPTLMRDDPPQGIVRRRLRALAGEMGEIDIAALAEMRKERTFVYEYYDTNSLVELDEAPPVRMSQDALSATLQFAKMVAGRPVDQVNVMRKTVVDGSNTSGFQRTALIARNGMLKLAWGEVTIPTICLEEDAARQISQDAESVTYRLDRLGIPLIEIATGPDMHAPEQVIETAETIGMLLRSTGRAKRGLGTIRQDVNVSIRGGRRVEIKGAQDLKLIPELVKNEALRQHGLLAIAAQLKGKPIAVTLFTDLTSVCEGVASPVIANALKAKAAVIGVRLPGAAGLLGTELLPNRRYGTELSDHARVHAGVKGIIHSDEKMEKYGLDQARVDEIRKRLACEERDAFVLVAAPKQQAEKALSAVIERHNTAFDGVPSEVRGPNADATTTYQRPMPGAARMYPETDIPTEPISKALWEEIKVPERIDQRAARYVKMGLAKDLADLAARSESFASFEQFARQFAMLSPAYIAETYFTSARTITRSFSIDISPTDADFEMLFAAVSSGQLAKEAVLDVLKENKPVTEILGRFRPLNDVEVDAVLEKIIAANPGKSYNAMIGFAMKELRGKVPGNKVAERLKARMGA